MRVEGKPSKLPLFNPVRLARLGTELWQSLAAGDVGNAQIIRAKVLGQQFGLNPSLAAEAAEIYRETDITIGDLERDQRLLHYHELLSRGSGLPFNPQEAAKTAKQVSIDPSVGNLSRHYSTIYGLPREAIWPAVLLLKKALQARDQAVAINIPPEKSWQHWLAVSDELIEHYQILYWAIK